jgi:hypothetical protein
VNCLRIMTDPCRAGVPAISIVQRKVLNPNDFANLESLAARLLDFQYYWEATARPFEWKFTRQDLAQLMNKLGAANAPAA